MQDHKKVLIAVAWPYVNGVLHVGHLAGYLLPADIAARYHRATGKDVLMVSGSDCFGTPITVEADKRGLKPEQVVEEHHKSNLDLFTKTLGLTYDLYTRTDHPNHIALTQDMFIKLCQEGYIFIDSTLQYFSPSENRFLPDRYVVGECPFCHFSDARSDQCDNCGRLIPHGELISPKSTLSGSEVELKQTEHYFLDWPQLQQKIKDYIDTHSGTWKHWITSEVKGWLEEGLRPRAITRDLDWGVPIPIDRLPEQLRITHAANKRIYVWFDAVIGYLSASKLWAEMHHKEWQPFWQGDNVWHYYFMGKDNLVFHTIFWPGQLIGYNHALHLPDVQSINMFLDLEGQKFSKSRGVNIPIKDFVETYGNNAVRFYLTYIMPEHRDTSFSLKDFEEKVNNVLVANLGNYIHRTLSLGRKLASQPEAQLRPDILGQINAGFLTARQSLEAAEFRRYLDAILELSAAANKFIDKERTWELRRQDPKRFEEVLYQLLAIVLALGYLIMPLLPDASRELFAMLGLRDKTIWPEKEHEAEQIIADLRVIELNQPTPLFAKVEIDELKL